MTFSIYGTHLGAVPSWGIKNIPTLGSYNAAKIIPVLGTTLHILIPL